MSWNQLGASLLVGAMGVGAILLGRFVSGERTGPSDSYARLVPSLLQVVGVLFVLGSAVAMLLAL